MTRTGLLIAVLSMAVTTAAAATGLWQGQTARHQAVETGSYSDGTACRSCTLRHQRLKREPAATD